MRERGDGKKRVVVGGGGGDGKKGVVRERVEMGKRG